MLLFTPSFAHISSSPARCPSGHHLQETQVAPLMEAVRFIFFFLPGLQQGTKCEQPPLLYAGKVLGTRQGIWKKIKSSNKFESS